MGTLAIEVELRQEDLTQAQYWLFRQNYFIRYFYAMFLVVLIYVAASSGSIHWNALKLQHLLLPAVVISLPVMSWSNARIAFRIAQLRGRLKFRYGCSLAGLRVASADAMVETPWTTYVSAWETTSSFYLFQHRIPRILLPSWKSVPVIIPKRCCVSPAEVGQLRAMIACALGKRARIRPA
jgi:hypothetical protein